MTMLRLLFSTSPLSRFVQIALPSYLAFQPTDGTLSVRINQQSQACFHGGLLGTRTAVSHSLTHQAIIDINIRAHEECPPYVYISHIFVYESSRAWIPWIQVH
jgi:hypothetical protein